MKQARKRISAFLAAMLVMAGMLVYMPVIEIEAAGNREYLGSPFPVGGSVSNGQFLRYPESGSFTMDGVLYSRGLTFGHNNFSGGSVDATLDIAGRSFTRLAGMFGSVSGSGNAVLTISADGTLIASFAYNAGDAAQLVDISIPQNTSQLVLRFQTDSSRMLGGITVGFGDAFLEGGGAAQQQQPPAAAGGNREYLSSPFPVGGSVSNASFQRYPASGSFTMDGVLYSRGLSFGHNNWSGGAVDATLDIAGQGFTRLAGMFGSIHGSGNAVLTISADGVFIASFSYSAGDAAQLVDISIPQNTSQLVLRFQTDSSIMLGGVRVGFGDAFLEGGGAPETIQNPHSSWARPELERARELDLIPTSLQDPQVDLRDPITRAEFAGVVVRTFEILANVPAIPAIVDRFTDTRDPYVLRAYNAGLMVGVSPERFDPHTLLNREQAATALTRSFKRAAIPGWTFATDADHPLNFEWPAPFADDANISSWARESVYFMAANDIIRGTGNNMFSPRAATTAQQAAGYAQATREQALIIALRMVENLG